MRLLINHKFLIVVLSHTVVDFISVTIIPLLTVLEGRTEITTVQGSILLALGSVVSGVIQPVAAWVCDHYHTKLVGPVGLVIAAAAYGSLGYATEFWHLVVIQIVAMLGVGAYHPVGATSTGMMSTPRWRSLAVSVFFVAGMAGHYSGGRIIPRWVQTWDMNSLIWMLPPAIIFAIFLYHSVTNTPTDNNTYNTKNSTGTDSDSGISRGKFPRLNLTIGILYAGNVIRFIVNGAIITQVIRWCEAQTLIKNNTDKLTEILRDEASIMAGDYNAAIVIGMAAGGLAAGAITRHGNEKWTISAICILGAPLMVMFPYTDNGWPAFILAIGTGIAFASSVPLTLSVAQRIMPHHPNIASSLMLGGAWLFAAIGPPAAQLCINEYSLKTAFTATAALLAFSGIITLFLPSTTNIKAISLPTTGQL